MNQRISQSFLKESFANRTTMAGGAGGWGGEMTTCQAEGWFITKTDTISTRSRDVTLEQLSKDTRQSKHCVCV